jgi:riboflavin biosynthesis pyrimidine reductase
MVHVPLDFAAFVERRAREAAAASIDGLITIEDQSAGRPGRAIGTHWTRRYYDGDFHLPDPPGGLPAVSLVFVQSADGNTGAADPATLGGGDTDRHLIYEGLSRVAADAVLAGAGTARGPDVFFSVWHPEIVALRASLGLPRHPVQIVLSRDGMVSPDDTLLFNVPDVPVLLLAGERCRERCRTALVRRPWVTLEAIDPHDLGSAFATLRQRHGIARVSAVGGRRTAASLIDADLVQDICLTTAPDPGGEPDTPLYTGPRSLSLDVVVRKRERASRPIVFEQLVIG